MRGLTSIFFINENASLPKATCGNSHPSIEREHLVFLSSLDESFDGNAAILKGSLIASRLVVHERLWGDQQNALIIDSIQPINLLSFLSRRRKAGTNGQTTKEMGGKE